jgi:hypothetical protein
VTPGGSPRVNLLLIPAASLLAAAIGFALGLPWLFPFLCSVPACGILWGALSRGRRAQALAGLLLWAATLGACGTAAGFLWQERAARVILNGPAYSQEMRAWIATGEGRESAPALFIPQHLLHLSIFSALAVATAGAAALVMGTVLLGYMSFHVGSLASAASGCSPGLTALLAWNPWSLVRVVSFIVLGVVLAEPMVMRWHAWRHAAARASEPGRARWLIAGLAGILADMLLKALLAPTWRTMLAACLG